MHVFVEHINMNVFISTQNRILSVNIIQNTTSFVLDSIPTECVPTQHAIILQSCLFKIKTGTKLKLHLLLKMVQNYTNVL